MSDASAPIGVGEVTWLLECAGRGDPYASGMLVALVYDELRRMAARCLEREGPGHTLDATALVHEMYLRMAHADGDGPRWQSRGHFFAAAAEAMRRILVDGARSRKARKRGGGWSRERFDPSAIIAPVPSDDVELLALDDALAKFQARDPAKAALVKLRYFAGLTIPEAAEALGISPSTADRHLSYARAWLRVELDGKKNP